MYSTSEYDLPLHKRILGAIDSYRIFQFYFPFEEKKLYLSPFRKDKKPSFSIGFNKKTNDWYYYDFGADDGGDCFKFVSSLFGLNYNDSCTKICNDFNIDLTEKKTIILGETIKLPKISTRKPIEIRFRSKNFTKDELEYWQQYGISEKDLVENEIYSISQLWIGEEGSLKTFPLRKELKFAYRFLLDGIIDKKKIYTPLNKEFTWIGNISQKHIEGLYKIQNPKSKNLIITKSRKDRIVLSKIHSDVINTQNEAESAILIKYDSVFKEKYENIFLFWDSDETGKSANKKLNHRGYKWINIPNKIYEETGCKDPADVIAYFGVEEGYKILKEEINKKIK